MWGRCIWREMSPEKIKEAKRKLSSSCSGEKNGFYGKHHTEENIKKITEKREKWRKTMTEEQKKEFSQKISNGQKKLFDLDPNKYIQNRKKAAIASSKSNKKYKMNKIEKIVQKELEKRDLVFEYSIILGYKQFDFGNKEHKILLEVQGDYWHSNPILYGENKIKINDIQKMKIIQDKDKKIFAEKNDMKLFIIWETDIKNNNFIIIDQIERIIKDVKQI